jgi:glycosyltransferase involved in cell wall biosynthesis
MPTVTVVLNCFNHEPYVAQAVESVLGQTLSDLELVAIDNGSTDRTPEILASYRADPRVRLLLHRENAPVSRRFNEGVEAARGDLVSFLYSDDFYLPTKLERQVATLRRLGPEYGVTYGPAMGQNDRTGRRWVYPSTAASGEVFETFLTRHRRGQIDMISPLIRRECLLEHRFYEDVFAEGEAIFLRIALTHRFAFVDEPLAVVRDHGGNAGKAIRRNCQITRVAIDRLRSHPRLRPQGRPLLDRYESMLLRNYGWQGVRLGGDIAWARSCLRDAVRLSPRHVLHPYVVLGYGLALLPEGARRLVNRAGHAFRRPPGNPLWVDEYDRLAARSGP